MKSEFPALIALVSLAMLVAVCRAATEPNSRNLLSNGGFEDQTTPVTSLFLQGWMTYGTPSTTVSLSTAERHSGQQSLRVRDGIVFCYNLAVEPQRDYVLTLWLKADGAIPRVAVNPPGEGKLPIPEPEPADSSGWRRLVIPLPASTRRLIDRAIELDLGARATGAKADEAVYYDDVTLQAVGSDANLVPNSSFEDPAHEVLSVPGWSTYAGHEYGSARQGVSEIALDQSVVHEGKSSLRIAGKDTRSRLQANSIDLAPLRAQGIARLRITAWARCQDMGPSGCAQMVVRGGKGGDVTILRVTGTSPWTQGATELDLSRCDDRLQLTIAVPQPTTGTAWFDDIRVEQAAATEPVNYLPNSTFTRCTAHARLPDNWGIWGTMPYCVRDWGFDHFGLDDSVASPVPGTRVLKFRYPPATDTFPPHDASASSMFYWLGWTPIQNIPAGPYVFSVYLKAARANTPVCLSHPSSGNKARFDVGADWKRYSHTAATLDEISGILLPQPDSTVWIAAPQWECAAEPTPYRPELEKILAPPADPSTATEDNTVAATTSGQPDTASPDEVFARGGPALAVFTEFDFYTTDAEARVKVLWQSPQPVTVRLTVHRCGDKESVLDNPIDLAFSGVGEQSCVLPLANLQDGQYEMQASALADGRQLAAALDKFSKLPPSNREVRLSRFTRAMVVDGKPFFPTFLPEYPTRLGDVHLQHFREAGFNTLCAGIPALSLAEIAAGGVSDVQATRIRECLDRMDRNGLKFVWAIPWSFHDWDTSQKGSMYGDASKLVEVFVRVVQKFKDHPAILGWYLMDEMCWEQWEERWGHQQRDLVALHQAIKDADPYRPAYINWNHSWQYEPYGSLACTDIVSHDYYPFDDQAIDLRTLLPSVRMINDDRAKQKPGFIWTVGSYGPPEIPRLARPSEVRVHGWLHLVYGSRGLGYWSGEPMNPAVWQTMKQLNQEACYLTEHALGTSQSESIRVAVHRGSFHYALWKTGNQHCLYGINISDQPLSIAVDVSQQTSNASLDAKRLFDQGPVSLRDGVLRDVVPPRERRAYVLTSD